MASITVRFYGLWSLYLDTNAISLEENSLRKVLDRMDKEYGCRLQEQLQKSGVQVTGKLQDYSLVLLNGINISNVEGDELKEGDKLQIFPPAAGG